MASRYMQVFNLSGAKQFVITRYGFASYYTSPQSIKTDRWPLITDNYSFNFLQERIMFVEMFHCGSILVNR